MFITCRQICAVQKKSKNEKTQGAISGDHFGAGELSTREGSEKREVVGEGEEVEEQEEREV